MPHCWAGLFFRKIHGIWTHCLAFVLETCANIAIARVRNLGEILVGLESGEEKIGDEFSGTDDPGARVAEG